MDFFASNKNGIAKTLLAGLGKFNQGLEEWKRRRGAVLKDFVPWGKKADGVGFPAGYVLAAICEITSIPVDLRPAVLSSVFGLYSVSASPPSDDDVIAAIEVLLDFKWLVNKTDKKDPVWIRKLLDNKHLLKGLIFADMWKRTKECGNSQKAAVRGELGLSVGERGAMLAGLVFVRSISNVYVKKTYMNEDRFVLASRAAKKAAELVYYKPGHNWLYNLQQSHEVVQVFLDQQTDENDDFDLDLANKWLAKV